MKPILTEQDFKEAAQSLGCHVAAIKAVCEVEAPRGGFLADGQITILFERHKFHQFTDGEFSATHPDISNPKPGGYGPAGQHQHDRLAEAVLLNRDAALRACSWGKFQLMGYNYKLGGFVSLQEMINAFSISEGEHLKAFVNFVKASKLDDELRARDWNNFAAGYNGANYRINKYDEKLSRAYTKYI